MTPGPGPQPRDPGRGAPLRLEQKSIQLRLRHAWTIARGTSAGKTNVLVRLEHGGLAGLGEAAPNVRYGEDAPGVAEALAGAAPLLGDNPRALDAILDRLEAALPGHPAARAAIDIALHDWIGRRDGAPLHRLLGGDPAAAPPTSFSIGLDAVDVMQRKVAEAEPFPILKIKLGRPDDRAILEGVRAVTGKPLYVDANEGWRDKNRALEMIRWMSGMGVALVEQPLPAADLEGARWLRERSDLPILADEAALSPEDLPRLAPGYDGVNVKLQKSGGLRAARRMIAAARALGMKVMIGCMIETSLGITAAAHLAPLCDYADLDGHLLIDDDPFRGVRIENGRLLLPDRPGLGIEGAWP